MDGFFDRKAQFLEHLELCNPTAHAESFANEVIETGGTWIDPIPTDADKRHRATHLFEISLHGIVGRGVSLDAAMTDWKTAARDSLNNVEYLGLAS